MEDKKKNKKKKKKKNSKLKKYYCYIFPFLILIFFYLFYKTIYDLNFKLYIKSIFFGLIILLTIYMFILGLFKKTHISSLIISIFFMIFTAINCIKIYYTNDPILFSDVKYLGDIFEITSIVDNSLLFASATVALPAILYIILNIFLLKKTFKYKYELKNIYLRIGFIIYPIIFFSIILFPSYNFKHFMLKNIYDFENKDEVKIVTSNIGYYGRFGIMSGMYAHYLENMIDIPETYNENQIKQEINNAKEVKEKKLKTPNIIVLFGESFWDISKVSNEVSFDKEITSNLNKLKNEGIYFEMVSPTFGGTTANVEFEFLTGANMAYFGDGYVPYMQLYTNKNYYNAPSIIHELKNNDYYTKVIAYTSPRLFNCAKFYKYAGFDYKEFNDEIEILNKSFDDSIKKGGRISDKHIVDEIIKEFDNKEKDKKEFYMVLTMQAHSPYTIDKYDKYDISITKSNFNKGMNESIFSYAQGAYDTDKQLGRLYEYVKTLDEPTLIIFFGDHLPHFTDNKGKSLLDSFEYFNTGNELLNIYHKYNTQALLLANFEIKEDKYKYLSPDLLSSYVLNNMDIKLSNYYKWMYSNIDIMPALNRNIIVDQKGNIFNVKDLPRNLNNRYNLRKSIQYEYFVKNK